MSGLLCQGQQAGGANCCTNSDQTERFYVRVWWPQVHWTPRPGKAHRDWHLCNLDSLQQINSALHPGTPATQLLSISCSARNWQFMPKPANFFQALVSILKSGSKIPQRHPQPPAEPHRGILPIWQRFCGTDERLTWRTATRTPQHNPSQLPAEPDSGFVGVNVCSNCCAGGQHA